MIDPERIEAASVAIEPVFRDTPCYRSERLSRRLGVELLCKVETVNPVGSFKGRGADWWMRSRTPPGRLVCASAGNFGLALAYAARAAGCAVEVFVAETANPAKVAAMEGLGARIHRHGADFDDAKAAAREHAGREGLAFVEDGREPAIAEGAGTIGLELDRQCADLDVVYVPVGNGALAAGVAAWLRAYRPATRLVGVCAAGAPAMARSLAEGRPVSLPGVHTVADGLAVREPVPEALAALEGALDEVVLVDDERILEALRALYEAERLVAEPAGAASLAAALERAERDRGSAVATLVCGANIDPRRRAGWLEGGAGRG